MKLTLPTGQNVWVSWRYETVEDKIVHGKQAKYVDKEQTTCIITGSDKQPIKTLSIKRYHTDKSDKEVARKETLRRILEDENKEIRTLYWNAYKNRNIKNK